MSSSARKPPENKKASYNKRIMHNERFDLITPAWRRFRNEHWWPASRLDRCSLDELRRLAKAVPYLQRALDAAIARKEACVR